MTRRNRQDLAPSLFPFLAVLVCTLGTLILLLAQVAQNTATSVEQKVREERSEKAKALATSPNRVTAAQAVAMIDEAAFRISAIETIRDKQSAVLEERRDQLTHLEDHIERLQKDLDRLNAEMVSATSKGQTDRIDSATIAMLKDQIADEELAIEELKEAKGNETPRVVIVPHKGPNGTTRRPIYVECTAAGLTIWPEGVKIATEQLTNRRSRRANPLDAALRVARLHVMKVYGDADPPYPLLVVRPHGTDAYFQATAAMDDWDDQYGYEMLDSDIELAFSNPDPNLKRRMEASIAKALARQTDRRTTKAVTLSASQLSRDGNSRGFNQRPNHGYGTGSSGISGGSNGFSQQTNRLNDIYRDAAQELRSLDGIGSEPNAENLVSGQQNSRTGSDSNSDPSSISDESLSSDESSFGSQAGSAAQDPSGDQNASIGKVGTEGSGGANQQSNPNHTANAPGTSSESCESCPPDDAQSETAPSVAQQSQTVQRDGDDWALPSQVANASGIAIIRSIRVQLYRDRFVVPASRTDKAKVIPFNGNLDRASLQLATVLRDRIDRWGVALDNGRWEPKLEVDAMDGDASRVGQLAELLKGSGIEVKERRLQ
jgi:hypothetical protein